MFLSYKWLQDYVEMPKSLNKTDLGNKLTMHTVEIDDVESQAEKFDKVVVGKILEIKKHPNADKLQLAVVDVKTEKLNIVCGAPNIEVGQLVPVALIGAVLPNGLELKPTKIRGEESEGMMCAEDELGMGDDHSGIMVLGENAVVGEPLAKHLELDDCIFEVDNKSITNRPDLWGHFGMAREIAVFLDTKFDDRLSRLKKETINIDEEKVDLKVKIENKTNCPRYMAVAMSNINIEPSPAWLQARLISAGVRPINNIVDVSNYVMLELGQPMHAFDTTKIAGDKNGKKVRINIRDAKRDEEIASLDGEKRELTADDLVIANDDGAIAIAGIMGGENSEIDENSSEIVLESANFRAVSIRQTSGRLGLRTEASQRFEKSLDPSFCEIALVRAVELIKKLCPDAMVVSRVCDEGGFSYKPLSMDIEITWLHKVIGANIEEKEIIRILSGLGFEPGIEDGILKVIVPSWRATKDIGIKEDIVEELARVYGYDNIEPKMPLVEIETPDYNKERELENKIRQAMSAGPAMSEVSNYSFVGEELLKTLGLDSSSYIRLANPITRNHTLLRQSLSSNMFDNVRKNQARYSNISLFEIGSVYLPIEGNVKKTNVDSEYLPLQEKRLGILVAGDSHEVYSELKSAITYLLAELGLEEPTFGPKDKQYHWSRQTHSASVELGNAIFGLVNVLDSAIAKKLGIKKKVAVGELYISEILKAVEGRGIKKFNAFEKYPAMVRDLSFILDDGISYNDIRAEIFNFHDYIKVAELFDVYSGDKLGAGKKSMAFHVVYQAEKTLTSKEVDKIQSNLVKHIEKKFEAKIRDF